MPVKIENNMKEIKLTKGFVALVDDDDYEWINSFKWCAQVKRGGVYAKRAILLNGKHKTIMMHRFIMNEDAKGVFIDHKNRIGLDNQRGNLRRCTDSQNLMNQVIRTGTSIYKGVSCDKRRKTFNAKIQKNNKTISLGSHRCETAAAIAYDKAAITHFGEFSRLNILKYTNVHEITK